MEIMMIHFKLKTSIYDTIDIYDKYGTYTSFIIPNKYSKHIFNGKTAKKILMSLDSPINLYKCFDGCRGSCGSKSDECMFSNQKRLQLANLNDKIDDLTYRIFYTLTEKNENNKTIYIWDKTIEGIIPNLS